MPSIYAEHHQNILERHIEQLDTSIEFYYLIWYLWIDENAEILQPVFGKHRNGYIFMLEIKITEIPSMINAAKYVASLHIDTKVNGMTGYILLDQNKYITDISSGKLFSFLLFRRI